MGGKSGRRPEPYLIVLTFAAGAVDALSYVGLGRVFTANMTGNIVLLGVAAGEGAGTEVLRSASALVGFVLGLWTGFRMVRRGRRGCLVTLVAELVLLLALAAGWAAHLRPEPLVIAAALAMGLQTAFAQRGLGVPGLTSTYVTGTLTGLLGHLAELGRPGTDEVRRTAVIVALAVGAAVAAVLLRRWPDFAPILPVVCVAVVLVLMLYEPRRRTR